MSLCNAPNTKVRVFANLKGESPPQQCCCAHDAKDNTDWQCACLQWLWYGQKSNKDCCIRYSGDSSSVACYQVDASPTTEWLYKELSTELGQLDEMHPHSSMPSGGMSLSQHCQLLLLQADAHQTLSKQATSTDRSVLHHSSSVVLETAARILCKLGLTYRPE